MATLQNIFNDLRVPIKPSAPQVGAQPLGNQINWTSTLGGGGSAAPRPAAQTPSGGNTGGGGSSSQQQQSSGGSNQQSQQQSAEDAAAQARQREIDAINAEFDATSQYLTGLESTSNQNADTARSSVNAQLPITTTAYNNQRTGRLDTLGQQDLQVRQDSEKARAQNAGLLSDLQRQIYARLSASGDSDSSVAQALAEQFGRKAFSAQNQVQQTRDNNLAAVRNKVNEVNSFYDDKIASATKATQDALNEITIGLRNTLSSISEQRGASAAAKAQANAAAWRSYIDQKNSINLQAFNYQQSLDLWKQQQSSSLAQAQGWNSDVSLAQQQTLSPNDVQLGSMMGTSGTPAPQIARAGQSQDDPNALLAGQQSGNIGNFLSNQA